MVGGRSSNQQLAAGQFKPASLRLLVSPRPDAVLPATLQSSFRIAEHTSSRRPAPNRERPWSCQRVSEISPWKSMPAEHFLRGHDSILGKAVHHAARCESWQKLASIGHGSPLMTLRNVQVSTCHQFFDHCRRGLTQSHVLLPESLGCDKIHEIKNAVRVVDPSTQELWPRRPWTMERCRACPAKPLTASATSCFSHPLSRRPEPNNAPRISKI